MYYYSDVEFAMCAIRVLGIILVVAFVAFALKSRAVLVAGSFGSLLGYAIEHGGRGVEVVVDGGAEELHLFLLERSAAHVFVWGIVGAGVASVVAFQVSRRDRCVSKRNERGSGVLSSKQCCGGRTKGVLLMQRGETRERPEFLPSRELSGRSEATASSPDRYSTSSEKSVVKHSIDEFLYSLVAWFLLLMTGLLTLTFVDLSVHGSENHAVGFPCTIMEWTEIGSYRDGQFYPSSILINVAVGVMFSAAIAFLLALNRYRSNSSWRHKE